MPASYANIQRRLKAFDFKGLFTQELMWNNYSARPLSIPMDGVTYPLAPVAEQRGMAVYVCVPPSGISLPNYATRRKIDTQVAKSAREHIVIFHDAAKTSQIWQWVKRESGKPSACREQIFYANQTGDALIQKILGIAFSLEEVDSLSIVDVTARVGTVFDVEKVTKKFYELFKKEHDTFQKFVRGIPDRDLQPWYVSVMLNRLMFIYFIQKKGFLNNDINYLRNKLSAITKQGRDKFFKDFLCPLFFEGFAKRERSQKTTQLLGNIPYLNGGLFLKHQIEEMHGEAIQIPDAAFERIFIFFEQYDWHLDDRPAHKGNEVNPDVLGYVFEKYVNQKEMGAYYTKEDVTEYIAKTTVIPAVLDIAREAFRDAFEGKQSVWQLLKSDPDRYIHAAVLHGMDRALPQEIAVGISDVGRRANWNKPASPEYALPTESWREVVGRRIRCEEIRKRLAAGEIQSINKLITHNLDIRRFAEEMIANCEEPDLLRAFRNAILNLSVLDPTCGSGAFLFAALNILERLYDTCLVRMQAFVDDLERTATKHSPEKFSDFRRILDEMNDKAQHPSPRYFVLKTIILNNLYGVDIMEEATEICKLRLFLKLVAQVNPGERIEPLPDIDFNIRAGNTLVGFATENELDRVLRSRLDFDSSMQSIKERGEQAELAFERFREMQARHGMKAEDFAEAKRALQQSLAGLRTELDGHLAADFGIKKNDRDGFDKWRRNHHPFHWFVEFYGIMKSGGFNVIIGNPPYVEIPKQYQHEILRKKFRTVLERWSRDEDVYTLIVERSLELLSSKDGKFGMILALSLAFSTKKPFQELRRVSASESGEWWWSHFDRIPSALFGNEVRTRCTIAILSRTPRGGGTSATTSGLLRWESEFRDFLFRALNYSTITTDIVAGIPKVASQVQADTLGRLTQAGKQLGLNLGSVVSYSDLSRMCPNFPDKTVFVSGTAYNWFPAWRDIPETTTERGSPSLPARTIGYRFTSEEDANIVFALLCSSMGYWWWAVASDGFNLKKWLLERFPLSLSSLPIAAKSDLSLLGSQLRTELKKHYVFKDNKGRIGNFFLPACASIISSIDRVLADRVPQLTPQFIEDIGEFNLNFSRASSGIETDVEDEDAGS